jgi:HTH-type transcriptional regulator, competence development regulator
MLAELGSALRAGRKEQGLSLAAAAEPARISAAYLHKLERGIVDNPSPRILARLAGVLDVPYMRLMELAGYLDEAQLAAARARLSPKAHPLLEQQLTQEEWKRVAAYIRKLVAARRSA